MKINRRNFIQTSTAGAAAAAYGCTTKAPEAVNVTEKTSTAVLKLSSQESRAPQEELAAKLDFLEENGFVGLEVGGKGLPGRVQEIKDALANRTIKASAVCAGFEGWLISPDPKIREQCRESMKKILVAAGELESTGLIFVPAFTRQESLPFWESREILIEQLKELGSFADSHGTRLLIEPLNRKECHFCRLVADGAAIARDVEGPGLSVMGDFWHMTWEETSDRGAFISGGDNLHHVHIASRKNRKMPGEDEGDNYVDGFRGLKEINYQDYVSLECGSIGDRLVTIPAAAELIRKQWEEA
jgi:sugar phosphate isomerase/epimerase